MVHLKPINYVLLVLLLFLFFLLRWNTFSAPFERDEGEYAYSAWILRQGIMPYENSFLQKPPLIIYTYALGQLFDPAGVVSPRVLAAVFSLVTIFLVALIAKKELGSQAGWISAFLLSPMLVLPYNASFSANTEHFMLTPLMAVMAIFFYKKAKAKPLHFFWAGTLSALSILYKPFPVYLLTFLFLLWFVLVYKKGKSSLKTLQSILLVVLGGSLVTLLVLAPFIIKGDLKYLIETALTYNRYYVQFIGFSPQAFITHNLKIFRVYWPLLLLIIFYLFKRPKNWWIYVSFLGISVLSIYQSWINHYYVFVMPFIALISGFAIVLIGKYEKWLTVIVIFLMLSPFWEQFSKTPQAMSLYIYGSVNPFYEAPLVAEKLASVTKSDDGVFVAGSEPEILFYAKRKSSSRFVITYPFNITTPLRERYQSEAVTNLESSPPKAIVYSTRQHSGLWNEGSPRIFIDYLNKLVADKYQLYGAYVWGNRGGYWLEKLSKDDLSQASLLLYLRK